MANTLDSNNVMEMLHKVLLLFDCLFCYSLFINFGLLQVKGNNLLLIDHPVGTGFSYASNKSLYVRTDKGAGKYLEIINENFT